VTVCARSIEDVISHEIARARDGHRRRLEAIDQIGALIELWYGDESPEGRVSAGWLLGQIRLVLDGVPGENETRSGEL